MTTAEPIDTRNPAEKMIEEFLKSALASNHTDALPDLNAADECKTKGELAALYAPFYSELYSFLFHAAIAHILIRVQDSYPAFAAGIAAEVADFIEDGGAYDEWVWEWADKRGLDPDRLIAEAKAHREEWVTKPHVKRTIPAPATITPEAASAAAQGATE